MLLAIAAHQLKRQNFGNAVAVTTLLLRRSAVSSGIRSEAHNLRGIAFALSGNMRRALTDFDAALSQNPKNASVYLNRAILAVRQRRFGGAFGDVNKAIAIRPSAKAYTMRASLQLLARNVGAALRDSDRAIKLDPRHATAWALRGTALLVLGNQQQARQSYNRALRLNPKHQTARRGLAVLNRVRRRGPLPKQNPAPKLPTFRML
ncbi:MAG: tetratricopeptide repeat protein [Bauldia litoralis]